jgi:hypothetical protein
VTFPLHEFHQKLLLILRLTSGILNLKRMKMMIVNKESSHEGRQIEGSLLLDLLDANKTLSQTIASLDIPNAKYEEIKFSLKLVLRLAKCSAKVF